jgi:putative ubiquitin-RnfH superfamily antitoxin RatB of RatAB toxin-antitoxin module
MNAMAMQVTVVYSPAARQVREWTVVLAEGATVRQAVQASGMVDEFPALDLAQAVVGVWNRKAGWEQPLREGDRIEVYRPLTVDPKVARRERFQKQGARATGLFSKRRPGGKPGY